MLDIKQLRTDFEQIKEKLAHRGEDLADFDKFGERQIKKEEN
ncbi:serine--tRNA ligase [Bacillus safensis FO-36b] [Bacillus safensis subsp. safensis]